MSDEQRPRAPTQVTRQDPIELRKRRTDAGLYQWELAEKVGCTQPAISQLETGERNATDVLLGRLARALDCGPDELRNPAYMHVSASPTGDATPSEPPRGVHTHA